MLFKPVDIKCKTFLIILANENFPNIVNNDCKAKFKSYEYTN